MVHDTLDLAGGSAPHSASPATMPDASDLAHALNERHGVLPAPVLLEVMLGDVFRGRIALVSSFDTESAVLLDLVAKVDRSTPILFLDTGKLFEKTLLYRDILVDRLALTDVRVLRPEPAALHEDDRDGNLWQFAPNHCCHLRKLLPLARGLSPFGAWITGRKRFQGGARKALPTIEADPDGRIKINPLANWAPAEIDAYFRANNLPHHRLEADGYRSIGCIPCTDRVAYGEDPRAGRWRHAPKRECGIHNAPARWAPAASSPPRSSE